MWYTKYNKRDKETKTMMNTVEYNVLYSNTAHSAENMCRILLNDKYVLTHPFAAYREGRDYKGHKLNLFDLLVLVLYYPFNGKQVKKLEAKYRYYYENMEEAYRKLNNLK